MVIKSKRASYAKTAGEALKWAVAQLKRKGITQPHLDAEVILVHTLALDRPSLYLQLNHSLSPTELEVFKQRIYRRTQHEPVAYILGKKEFWSLDLTVAPEVLIPRPETELLIEETLRIVRRSEEKTVKILDIGTGSGNIAISLARELDRCWILALDISLKALLLARNNIHEHQVKEKVQLLAADMFQPLKHDSGSFHIIVSNPPYIPEEDWNDLPPDIKDYEPRIALDGGKRGERFLRHIVRNARKYILPGGYLLLEIGYDQADPVQSWIKEKPGLTCLRIIPDYSRIPRIVVIKKS